MTSSSYSKVLPYTEPTFGLNSALWKLLRTSPFPGPMAAPLGGDYPYIQVPYFISLTPATFIEPPGQRQGRAHLIFTTRHLAQDLAQDLAHIGAQLVFGERVSESSVVVISMLQLGN